MKVIVFSEWERMLELVREPVRPAEARLRLAHRHRAAADAAAPRSTPSRPTRSAASSSAPIRGATGLNLQNASVVINCDLPWNPAKLEQRIARAWRKHQTRAVTVINLVSENTIEHRMLDTLANKQALADGVLDRMGDLKEIKLQTGRQAFLAKLQQLVAAPAARRRNPRRARQNRRCRPTARAASPPPPASASTAPCSAARSATRMTPRTRCSTSWSSAMPRNTASNSALCTRNTSARASGTRWLRCAWK